MSEQQRIVVAGATGNLGSRIVKALRERGAQVVVLTRKQSSPGKVEPLRALGAEIVMVEPWTAAEISTACRGASCVVSALLGMRDVMVDAQTVLLEGAVQAGVPRFIPSDYALDFNQLAPGENRNLDWHREFQQRLDRAPIAATSILNGMFMELLLGNAPFILFKWNRVLYWENADQVLEFTSMDDVAKVTAAAALDPAAPRFVRVAGDRLTARQLAAVTSEVMGRKFKLQWAGNVTTLNLMIRVMRKLMPAENDPFPPWQGMQYSRAMFAGVGVVGNADADRYPGITRTKVRDLLAAKSAADS
jgi:nucleoside-diphosphate-sugar epimerase